MLLLIVHRVEEYVNKRHDDGYVGNDNSPQTIPASAHITDRRNISIDKYIDIKIDTTITLHNFSKTKKLLNLKTYEYKQ